MGSSPPGGTWSSSGPTGGTWCVLTRVSAILPTCQPINITTLAGVAPAVMA